MLQKHQALSKSLSTARAIWNRYEHIYILVLLKAIGVNDLANAINILNLSYIKRNICMVFNKIITESDGVFILCFCQYCVVSCRTIPLTATSQSVSSRPGAQDFVEKTGQVLGIDFFFLKKRPLIRSISVSTCKTNIIVFYNKVFKTLGNFLFLLHMLCTFTDPVWRVAGFKDV